MRIYFPLTPAEIQYLASGESIEFNQQLAVSPTPEMSQLLEITDADELTLIAALTAADLAIAPSAIAVIEAEGELGDAELGEVFVTGSFALAELECFLVPDLENDEVSWFGIQETAEVLAALADIAS